MSTSSIKKWSSELLQYVELLPYIVVVALASLQADWISKYILAGLLLFSVSLVVLLCQPHSIHILLAIPLLFLSHSFENIQYAIVTSLAAAMTLYGSLKSKLDLPAWMLASGALSATIAAMGLSHPYLDVVVQSPPVQMMLANPYGKLALSVGFAAILQWLTMKYLLTIGIGSFHNVEAVIISQLLCLYINGALKGLDSGASASSTPSSVVVQLIAITAWIGFWFFEFFTKLQQPTGVKLSLTSSLAVLIAGVLFPFFSSAVPNKLLAFVQKDINFYLLAYWVACFLVFSALAAVATRRRTSNTIARKTFHLMALAMFLPAMILDPAFLRVSFSIAIALFALIEFIRYSKILGNGIADMLTKLMSSFTNERDRVGPLTVSHTYLLIGCGIALLSASESDSAKLPLEKMTGPLFLLAVGDSFASIVGSKFGKHKWRSTGSKTIEGSIAGILTTLGSMVALTMAMGLSPNWISISVATTFSFVLEAYTDLIDNLLLPIFYLSAVNLLG